MCTRVHRMLYGILCMHICVTLVHIRSNVQKVRGHRYAYTHAHTKTCWNVRKGALY